MPSDSEFLDALQRADLLTKGVPGDLRSTAYAAILRTLLGGAPLAAPPTTPERPRQQSAQLPATTGMTINELLVASGASTHPERVVVIAHHHLQNGGGGITTKDISDAYAKARTKKPQNIPDVVGQCVQRGYLIDAEHKHGSKSWVITPTGEQFVSKLLATRKRNV